MSEVRTEKVHVDEITDVSWARPGTPTRAASTPWALKSMPGPIKGY